MKNLIKNIAIVDDTSENIKAAVIAVKEFLPAANISTFNSLTDFCNEVGGKCPKYDFVITDMNMEDKNSGFKLSCLCWSWMIPAIIVSGGFGHGKECVSVGHIGSSFWGTKEDVEVWTKILEQVFIEGEENPINLALKAGKSNKQSELFGEIGGYASTKFV